MKQQRLNLYLIDMKYIRNLARADDNVMSVSPQIEKESRPFVGIVIVCECYEYCIPLSSPKAKHSSMKNDVDFMKIIVDEKLIGVLNFNNMIPVDAICIKPLDLKITSKDNSSVRQYKKLAAKQLDWCRRNQESIVKKANKLYRLLQSSFYQLSKFPDFDAKIRDKNHLPTKSLVNKNTDIPQTSINPGFLPKVRKADGWKLGESNPQDADEPQLKAMQGCVGM